MPITTSNDGLTLSCLRRVNNYLYFVSFSLGRRLSEFNSASYDLDIAEARQRKVFAERI